MTDANEPRTTTTEAPLRLRDFWLAGVLALVSWLVALYFYPRLPAEVPVHWGIDGQPDRWASRLWGTLLWPLVTSGTALLLAVIPFIDPRKRSYPRFRTVYLALVPLLMAFFLGMQLLTMRASVEGSPLDLGRWVGPAIGLLFVALGFVMPRFEPNWFVGIRTPWTLEDDRVWRDTHRVGGRVFIAMGLLLLLAGGLFGAGAAYVVTMGGVLAGVLGIVVYSFLRYRVYHPQGRASESKD